MPRLTLRHLLPLPLQALPATLLGLLLGPLLCLTLAWPAAGAAQTGLQAIPALSGRVIDQTGTLDAAAQQQISTQLAGIETRFGTQVVVLMVPTTQPEDIAAYAYRVASAWKIGRRDVGDGLLLLIAKQDRALRIEVARALEGTVPDIAAARIIDNVMVPHMRQGDFATAISAGIDAVAARLAGDDSLPAPAAASPSGGSSHSPINWESLLVLAYLGIVVGSAVLRQLLGRKLGALASGAAVGAVLYFATTMLLVAIGGGIVTALLAFSASGKVGLGSTGSGRGGWGGGRSGGSSGSGGFRSGGGGSFGGGGASGRW
ncbi:YgcG family protein [Corticibacter populi]|uniref:YgcG family protein n=1 Tax=Corticibacter populi TaxID=1550736 RepID=A0A3M6QIU5_9BURK|nr:TPM domain-containing protein [Corticibacter populi]RMX03000.1 YgcG family protein [Corticibacter populi]RZS33430.1 uncharacterized protein EV687_1754 [Corticibacter populi]